MIRHLTRRFCRDDRGVFAVIFGLIAIVLVAMAGAAVDLVTIDQARNRVQIALDSAALALQPKIYDTSIADLKTDALALVEERVDDGVIKVVMTDSDVSKNSENGQLYLQVHVTVPMSFVALLGINQMETLVASQVTRKKLALEVAMVLDNSGSMGNENRMTNLKLAAENATCILFYGKDAKIADDREGCTPADATKDPHTKVAIVPFTFFVRPVTGWSDALKTWVDKDGKGSIANDNIDTDDDDSMQTLKEVDRIALMESLAGTKYDWKGCFEERIYPYNVDDTTPNPFDPDTLFTPEFAPDEPGTAGNPEKDFNNSYVDDDGGNCTKSAKFVWTQTKTGCWNDATNNADNYNWCGSWAKSTYELTDTDGTTTTSVTSPPSKIDGLSQTSTETRYVGTKVTSWFGTRYTNEYIQTYYYGPSLSDREKQERFCKYAGATVKENTSDKKAHEPYTQGPNAGCPNAVIQPLTDEAQDIIDEIESMNADGGTNIGEGAAWGFRVLSPTEPFTEGTDYDSGTSKVIILMTDGENTYWNYNQRYEYRYTADTNMNGTYYYMPFGYQYNQRLTVNGTGPYFKSDEYALEAKMNDLTEKACTNAKNAGIVIYTIGLKSPNDTTKNMLKACATKEAMARFPTDPSQLNEIFSDIASELSELRIEK